MLSNWSRGVVVSMLVFLCRAGVAAPPAEAPPVVSFEGSAVIVTAIVPGETAILYGIAHDPEPYGITTRNIIHAETAGSDGRARFAFDRPLPAHTVLAAVDASTGRYAIASPGNPAPPVHTLPADAFKKRQDPEYELLDVTTTWLELLCVRPGKGAWYQFATDGALLDLDGRSNGRMLVESGALQRVLGPDDSPKKFKRHDVIVIIDPRTLTVFATEVPE